MEPENTETAPGDRKAILIAGIVGLCFFLLLAAVITNKSGAEQYLGDWEAANGTAISIEAKPDKEVKQSFTLRNGDTANLVLPVRVRSLWGESLWLMVEEGIYEVKGKHALIFYCKLCRIYVLFGLEATPDQLQVGLPEYGWNDRSVHDQMWNHGQSRSKFYYGDFRWVTYRRLIKSETVNP